MKNISHRKIGGVNTAFYPGYEREGLSVYTEAVSIILKIINPVGMS
jgi:hypothetical protein